MAAAERQPRKRRDLSLSRQTDAQVADAAEVSASDLLRAGVEWALVAPAEFTNLLDATEDDAGNGE